MTEETTIAAFNEAIRDDLEIEVLRAEPHTFDQAIATAHKQENLNVKLGLNTFKVANSQTLARTLLPRTL